MEMVFPVSLLLDRYFDRTVSDRKEIVWRNSGDEYHGIFRRSHCYDDRFVERKGLPANRGAKGTKQMDRSDHRDCDDCFACGSGGDRETAVVPDTVALYHACGILADTYAKTGEI